MPITSINIKRRAYFLSSKYLHIEVLKKSPFQYISEKKELDVLALPLEVCQVVNNSWKNDIVHPYLDTYIEKMDKIIKTMSTKTMAEQLADKGNLQAVVTVKACIFVEVVGNVITPVAVWPIFKVNEVELPWNKKTVNLKNKKIHKENKWSFSRWSIMPV